MRLLREYVRALLVESAVTVGNLPASVGLYEHGDVNYHLFAIVDKNLLPDLGSALLGGITIDRARDDRWYVMNVSSVKGYGPLLYRLSMEFATENGGALMAHPSGNTPLAANVWATFDKLSRSPGNELVRVSTGEPMRPAFTLNAGDLKMMRARSVNLTEQQHREVYALVKGLEIGGRRPELDD